jgi:hypothetical protein
MQCKYLHGVLRVGNSRIIFKSLFRKARTSGEDSELQASSFPYQVRATMTTYRAHDLLIPSPGSLQRRETVRTVLRSAETGPFFSRCFLASLSPPPPRAEYLYGEANFGCMDRNA